MSLSVEATRLSAPGAMAVDIGCARIEDQTTGTRGEALDLEGKMRSMYMCDVWDGCAEDVARLRTEKESGALSHARQPTPCRQPQPIPPACTGCLAQSKIGISLELNNATRDLHESYKVDA